MLKDPNSTYIPKERGTNWLKLKGDYVDGMTDTMDVVIIGGYFGDLSFRLGKNGHHWTNQVTSFLIGVLEHRGEKGKEYVTALPFARVGTGFPENDLI
jgi:DNA ligase-4